MTDKPETQARSRLSFRCHRCGVPTIVIVPEQAENDELRAEVERLKHLHNLDHSLANQWEAEVERLRAALAEFASISRTGEPVDMPDAKAMWRRVRDVVDRHME